MGRAYNPGINRNRLARTDPLDHPLLQKAQQFNLQRQRDIANFIEEQRAPSGHFDLALGGLDRSGKGALLMPEQLAFEQVFRDCRTVDRNEGAMAAVARFMQAAGQQFLAGPAGTQQHHRDVGVGDAFNRPGDFDHFRRRGDQPAQHPVLIPRFGGQQAVFRFDPMKLRGAANDQSQGFDINRLLVEIVGPLGDRLERRFARTMARCDNDFGVRLQRHDLVKHGKAFTGPIGIWRQAKIERHHRRFLAAEQGNRPGPVRSLKHLKVRIGPFELGLQSGVILDDQQLGFGIRHQATF